MRRIRDFAVIILLPAAWSCIKGPTPSGPTPRSRATMSRMAGETSAEITPEDLEVRLTAFAADSMMGREAGTYWGEKAADYVAGELQKIGVQPAGENGGFFQIVPNIHPRDTTKRVGFAKNVIGIIPGADPSLRGEYVSITAHNDHIGFSHRVVDHDSIRAYNAIIRPLGADSRPHPPSPDEAAQIHTILDSLRKLHSPR